MRDLIEALIGALSLFVILAVALWAAAPFQP